jgi:glycosyltransferase involved in cell wall biosynthesis
MYLKKHHMPLKKLLIIASTFPAADTDPVPAFVKDQIVALKKQHPELEISVLAPHDMRSRTVSFRSHEHYNEYRFHYFWPFHFERLAGRGIVPTLKQRPVYYALIPFLIGFEFFALLRLSRRLKPDVVYAHWFTPQGISAGMVSMIVGVPFVYTSHSSDVAFLHKLPIVGPFFVRYFTKRARAVTVVSRRSLEKLRSFFNAADWRALRPKVAVIPMGVALPAATNPAKLRPGKIINILFIGRLAEKKGVHYLLPAFNELLKSHPNVKLTIAGDGPWLDRLQKQVKSLAIPEKSIAFSGYASGNRKAKLIANSDIFVVPSIITAGGDAEGLPVALMEGLAAGKICIATRESGADDIIDSKSGYVIPQKDVGALADALKSALELKPAARRNMQRAARDTARQFAWPVIAEQHYKFLFTNL